MTMCSGMMDAWALVMAKVTFPVGRLVAFAGPVILAMAVRSALQWCAGPMRPTVWPPSKVRVMFADGTTVMLIAYKVQRQPKF